MLQWVETLKVSVWWFNLDDEKMKKPTFSKDELERYSRHLILPEFNIEGQCKLKAAKVLVVGAGGLGSPLLLYLVAAGVGTLGIIDFDTVDKSNLQRQVIFTTKDVGKLKIDVVRQRLMDLNPYVNIITHNTKLTSKNAFEIIKKYDVIADGTDNFPTRYLVNDACVLLDKVLVYASIYRFEGQISVFNFLRKNGSRGPNYRDLFPEPPAPDQVPNCAEGGVIGVLPGIIGAAQANEVIKVITGIGQVLDGRLFVFDAASFDTRILKIGKNPKNPLNGENPTQKELIDYEQFCGFPSPSSDATSIKSIDVFELKKLRDNQKDFQLIDVREPYEYEVANLGGQLMPKGKINEFVEEISKNKKVIIYCQSGHRSTEVILELEKKYGYTNLYNLAGGILAWMSVFDD